jgi:hydroxymethylbilane synthase
MRALTVVTRGGALAVAQTEIITAALKKARPDIRIEIKTITTKGDRDRRTALWDLKGTGFFTSQLEDALLAGEADFAVHSFKDLPTAMRDGLVIAAVCDRQFAEDCLVSTTPLESIEQLPIGAKVGTSSLRRIVQLKRLRPDLQAAPIRGNVKTRLKKLDAGDFDAIILARAGMERLGLGKRISFMFDPAEFIPAAAQGALAVQTRTGDIETNKLIAAVDDKQARTIVSAERKVLSTLKCGCHAPVGVFAQIAESDITIYAFVSDLQGQNFVKLKTTGPVAKADSSAAQLARDILASGGSKILQNINRPKVD